MKKKKDLLFIKTEEVFSLVNVVVISPLYEQDYFNPDLVLACSSA
jgi:hypothetical protein